MKKKPIALILALMLCLSLATPALAADSDFNILDGVLVWYEGSGADVVVPDGVTTIESFAFAPSLDENTNLTSVTIPSSVTSIYGNAFAFCPNLKSVIIPASVTDIDYTPFRGCTSLTDVYFGGTQEQWEGFEQRLMEMDGPIFYESAIPTVHYNSAGPGAPAASETSVAPTTPTVGGFSDVPADAWYADAVKWAIDKGITNGTSDTTFSPNDTCTTAQIITFLWRAKGEPAPKKTTVYFNNVKESDYYYNAACWAIDVAIEYDGGTGWFPGDRPCTRYSTVEYLWTLAGYPGDFGTHPFTDADNCNRFTIGWAVQEGITSGTSNTTFSPDDTCTRAQIVTFLYRAYA